MWHFSIVCTLFEDKQFSKYHERRCPKVAIAKHIYKHLVVQLLACLVAISMHCKLPAILSDCCTTLKVAKVVMSRNDLDKGLLEDLFIESNDCYALLWLDCIPL